MIVVRGWTGGKFPDHRIKIQKEIVGKSQGAQNIRRFGKKEGEIELRKHTSGYKTRCLTGSREDYK